MLRLDLILPLVRLIDRRRSQISLFPTGSGVLFHHQMPDSRCGFSMRPLWAISFVSSSGISTPVGAPRAAFGLVAADCLQPGADRALDGICEVGFTVRLLNNHRTRSKRPNTGNIAADEHVRNGPGAEYFLDGGNAASIAQPHIDDHQVRPASYRGSHRIGFGGLDRTDVVAHLLE